MPTSRHWRLLGVHGVLAACALAGCARTQLDAFGLNVQGGSAATRSSAAAGGVGGTIASGGLGSSASGSTGMGGDVASTGGLNASGAGGTANASGAGAASEGGASGGVAEAPAWLAVPGVLAPSYIYAIAAAPSAVGVVYAGNHDGGGVYRTESSGSSWQSASNGLRDGCVHSLAVDPFAADHVWVGTASGLYSSRNAGASWSAVELSAPGYSEAAIITVDPTVKGRVYLVLNADAVVQPILSALFRSNDDGLSWDRVTLLPGARVSAIDVDLSDSNHVFLGTYNQGAFESHDACSSFQPLQAAPTQTYRVVADPHGTWCASVSTGAARSLDGGSNWVVAPMPPPNSITFGGGSFYATGDAGVYRSPDCATWTLVEPNRAYMASVDAGGSVYVATVALGFQGVRRSPNGISAFSSVNTGIDNADVRDVIIDPSAPNGLFLTANYHGIYHSLDNGSTFASINGSIGHVDSTAFPDSLRSAGGQTLVGFSRQTAGRVFRTSDLGVTWHETLLPPTQNAYPMTTSLLLDPDFRSDGEMYVGTMTALVPTTGLFGSIDGGVTFNPRGNGKFNTQRMIWDAVHPEWIWAIGSNAGAPSPSATNEALYLSQDTGQTWSSVPLSTPGRYSALAAAITPEGEALYLAVDAVGVLKSSDEGSSWSLTGTPPGDAFRALVVDPSAPATLYAATGPDTRRSYVGERGIYKSRDGGASWLRADQGIVAGIVQALAIDPRSPNLLYAAMISGGLFTTTSGGE